MEFVHLLIGICFLLIAFEFWLQKTSREIQENDLYMILYKIKELEKEIRRKK